ncbi:MAG: tetratricopeptide repeat protein [Thermodesulfobacteriota bacterium]|nr:tetratricopeptide repeat protein [Thermodesulfobacteriota bacterium]
MSLKFIQKQYPLVSRIPTLPPCNPHLLAFSLLTSLIIIAYYDVFGHEFVSYDDYRIIVNHIKRYDGLSLHTLQRIFLQDFPREEPLLIRDVSYLINAQIFGALNAAGYLVGNILFHITVSFLVYLVCLRFFPGNVRLALLSSVIFAVHPLHSESVAWISARKDILYTLFYLLAFYAYMCYLRKSRRWYLLSSTALFLCSLLSKAAAISFLPLLLCYRLIMCRKIGWKRCELIYFLTILTTTLYFIWWYTGVLRDFGLLASQTPPRIWGQWFLLSAECLTFYIQKLLLPLHLSAVYDFPSPNLIFKYPLFLLISLSLVAISIFLAWRLRTCSNKIAYFFAAWFVCALLPYLDLAQVGIYVADRYAYLASIPVIIGLACFLLFLYDRLRQRIYGNFLAVTLAVALIGILTQQTASAAAVWQNSITLWQNVLQQVPRHMASYTALMGEYIKLYRKKQNSAEGAAYLAKAKRVGLSAMTEFRYGRNKYDRALHLVTVQLAQISWFDGDLQQAQAYLHLTLQLQPEYLTGRYLYARLLAQQGKRKAAMNQVNRIEKNGHPYFDRDILTAARALKMTLDNRP